MKSYTVAIAAEMLGVSVGQVARLIKSEALQGFDVALPGSNKSAIRVTGESIEAFIERRTIRRPKRRTRRRTPPVVSYTHPNGLGTERR